MLRYQHSPTWLPHSYTCMLHATPLEYSAASRQPQNHYCSLAKQMQLEMISSAECASYLYYYVMPQITEKLLQAEEKKLRVLKAEIEAGKHTDTARDTAKVQCNT